MPADTFRLGKTRVFFRAGQISTLQEILNDTSPDKAKRIYSRLEEALANRQKAKAAAQEAQVKRPCELGCFLRACVVVRRLLLCLPELGPQRKKPPLTTVMPYLCNPLDLSWNMFWFCTFVMM